MRLLNILRGRGSSGGLERLRAPDSPDPEKVPLGETATGERVCWVPGNLLLSGYPGSGTDTALLTLLRHFTRYSGEWNTYLVDPRALEFPRLAEAPGVADVALGLVVAERLLEGLRRSDGAAGKRTALLVAGAEELVFRPERGACGEHLGALLRAGDVHVVLGVMRPDRLPVEGVENMDALRMRPDLERGWGWAEFLASPDGSEPVELQTYATLHEDLERREE